MKKLSLKLVLLLTLVLVGVIYSPKQETFAGAIPDTQVKVCAVSYIDESILVFTNGNSKIYYATEVEAARNIWDVVEVSKSIEVIDFSSLSSNVENVILIKGDKDGTQSRVIIKKKPFKLEVSINYSQLDSLDENDDIGEILNVMSSEGTANAPLHFNDLEWRKGEDGRWLPSYFLTKRVLENYLVRGATLNFRVAPVDDIVDTATDIRTKIMNYPYEPSSLNGITFGTEYPDGTKGRRASNAVKLKITKQVALPVIGVDGEDFNVNIKYGQEYRVTTTASGSSVVYDWTKVTDRSIRKLPISAMVEGTSDGLTASTAFPEMLIEIRNYSTSKASSSKITETHLSAQRILPGTIITGEAPSGVTPDNKNIYISYNGSKNINIQIPSASSDNPYEYTVVRDGYSFDVNKATWSAITKSTIVKVLSSKAVDKSTIYIRQKAVKYKPASATSSPVAFKLASTMEDFKVSYPSMPTTQKKTYIFTKGYTTALTIDVTLNTKGKLPFETELKYIKLGTKDVPVSEVQVTPSISGGIDPNTVYTMSITLNATELNKMVNSTARALSIYYKNGTVDKTSAKLTIKNPTDAISLTTTTTVGSADGTTKIILVSTPGIGNSLRYEITSTQVTGKKMEDKFEGTNIFTDGMDIAITADQYLTIYEINSDKYIMKYKSIQIKASEIKQPSTPSP